MSAFIRDLVREAYAQHELFCMLGFDPEHIFIEVINVANAIPTPGLCATVVLRMDGKFCSYTIARVTPTQGRAFLDALRVFTLEGKAKTPRAELDQMVRGSRAWGHRLECIACLHAKGFDVEPGRMVH
jgi:hypothetical protein